MKAKAINSKRLALFVAISLTFLGWEVASAGYHFYGDPVNCPSAPAVQCTDCHDVHGGSGNLSLIADQIRDGWCNQGDMADVEFTTVPDHYADGSGSRICEVCHTRTNYYRNDATSPGGDHHVDEDCMTCHAHCDEFLHGGGSGVGCDECHGTDAGGAGTIQSHSTHTENDADDVKGPFIACDACHDTNNYPYFKSGIGDEPYDLTETDVCDACHSPDGAYPGSGGLMNTAIGAKANWKVGGTGGDKLQSNIYEADGTTLRAGKEKWCATCHDDDPAISKPPEEVIEVIVDNVDGTPSGAWFVSSWAPGYYGTDYHYHAPGAGTDTFTWTPPITPPGGTYTVYARWTSDPSRARDATYTIHHDDGTAPVTVDQRFQGGTWVALGTYFFDGVNDYVELVESPNGYVIADSVKWASGASSTYAPNVVGDDLSYGFYVTGHKINCLSCHDAGKSHIDGEHRTYEAGVTVYSDSYRLRDVNGQPAMNIPRPLYPPNTNPLFYWQDFALCFDCHNRYEVLNATGTTTIVSNFWNNDASPQNSHNIHLGIRYNHFDSDWDGVVDSPESCTACHNVHGARNQAMIRHGELISTYGTTDKVPALNFAYLMSGGTRDTSITVDESIGGNMNYVSGAVSKNHVCQACHSAISYSRDPYLGPRVLYPQADPGTVDVSEGAQNVLLTVTVRDPDNDVSAVTIDLSEIGGSNAQHMFDDQTHGDQQAGDGIYSYQASVPGTTSAGIKSLAVKAMDPSETGKNTVVFTVIEAGTIIVDNVDGTPTGTWETSSWAPGYYGTNYHYHVKGAGSDIFTWTLSVTTPGTYEVFARWTADSSRSPDATYTVYHDGGTTPVQKNQRLQGGTWVSLGIYSFDGAGIEQVELGQSANGNVVADAIKVAPPPPPEPEVIVDNIEGTYTGAWGISSWASDRYGDNYHYHLPGSGSDTFTWEATSGVRGSYEVFAWWTQDPSRALDATYTVYHDSGSTPVPRDQRTQGGMWVSLGVFSFDGTGDYVELTQNPNGYVIADAVRFVLQEE